MRKYRSPLSVLYGYEERVDALGVAMECVVIACLAVGAMAAVIALWAAVAP